MELLVGLLEEYKDALHTDNKERIKRLGELLRRRMDTVEKQSIRSEIIGKEKW